MSTISSQAYPFFVSVLFHSLGGAVHISHTIDNQNFSIFFWHSLSSQSNPHFVIESHLWHFFLFGAATLLLRQFHGTAWHILAFQHFFPFSLIMDSQKVYQMLKLAGPLPWVKFYTIWKSPFSPFYQCHNMWTAPGLSPG